MRTRQQHQELVDIAKRIVLRHQQGRYEQAAELIVRALTTSDADQTFALALAMTEQALLAVEESRIDAVNAGRGWQPAMRLADGSLVTPADATVAPLPLAMRLIDAMHRSMALDPSDPAKQQALADLGTVYETAAAADHAVFHGLFAALASYAAHGRADNIDITLDSIEDPTQDRTDVFVANSAGNSRAHSTTGGLEIPGRHPLWAESPRAAGFSRG